MKDPRRRTSVPPEELSAWERWEMPLLDEQGNEVPQEEERDVKPLTAADIDAIRQSAWEEGKQEGHEAGYQEGLKLGREEGHQQGYDDGQVSGEKQGREQAETATRATIDEKMARLETLLGELVAPIERHQDELESALVNLAIVVARSVLWRELSLDSSQIQAVVKEAVAGLPSTRENVRIRINPADLDWVQEIASRLDAEVSLVEDPDVLAGGCTVETRHSLVDYTVEKRFQKAVQGMLDQQLDHATPGESEELASAMGDLSDYHREVLEESGAESSVNPEPLTGPSDDPVKRAGDRDTGAPDDDE